MSGFTAPAATPTGPALIANDAWWPAVDPAQCRQQMRMDGTISDPRLRAALVTAMASVNHELAAWRATQQAAGVLLLADVPAPQIDGQSVYVHQYLHAVRATAHAQLIERYRNYDLTNDGEKKAESMTASIDELRRDARWAIAEILGHAHTTVELI